MKRDDLNKTKQNVMAEWKENNPNIRVTGTII